MACGEIIKLQHRSAAGSALSYHIPGTRYATGTKGYLEHFEAPKYVSSVVRFAAGFCPITGCCCSSVQQQDGLGLRNIPEGAGTTNQIITSCSRCRFLAPCRACRLVALVFARQGLFSRKLLQPPTLCLVVPHLSPPCQGFLLMSRAPLLLD